MNIGILYYDMFANHEVIIACHEFRRHNIMSIGLEQKTYLTTERQKLLAEYSLNDLSPKDIDVFIIPGGITDSIQNNDTLIKFIRDLHSHNRILAGICGGTFLLANSGVLENKRCTGHFIRFEENTEEIALFQNALLQDEDVVVDGNIVTARGKAFIEFGLELAKTAGVIESEVDYNEEYAWLKNQI